MILDWMKGRVALGILSRDGREGGEGKKAAVNAPQSKRFARDGEVRWSRQRLDCGGFSTAFRDDQQGASALKGRHVRALHNPQSEFRIGNGRTGRTRKAGGLVASRKAGRKGTHFLNSVWDGRCCLLPFIQNMLS
jgi:hypothetical protein